MIRRFLAVVVLSACAVSPGYTQAPPAWPDSFVGRLAALAMIQTLNAELLASRSATQTLEKWCGDHRLAPEPKIVADLSRSVRKTPTAEQLARLQVTGTAEVTYRHVQLRCGSQVLSEADNWYVPARLTADMNHLLETTTTPFGTAVRSLEPSRETLAVAVLWPPGVLHIPDALFAHRAVLFTRDHVPFSEVYEVYQRQILAIPPPRLEW